jgi:hypothetical protein
MSTEAEAQSARQDDAFTMITRAARQIKVEYVDKRIKWYDTHTKTPRWFYYIVGVLTILLSVTLPALASAQFPHKQLVVSVVSVVIAALTGLGSFFHWERTWRGNSTAQVAIEQAVGKWELELKRAEFVVEPKDRIDHVIKATDDLLANTGTIVSSESEGFFSNLHATQQNSAGKP